MYLQITALPYTALHSNAGLLQHYTVLHCSLLNFTLLYCWLLHFTELQYNDCSHNFTRSWPWSQDQAVSWAGNKTLEPLLAKVGHLLPFYLCLSSIPNVSAGLLVACHHHPNHFNKTLVVWLPLLARHHYPHYYYETLVAPGGCHHDHLLLKLVASNALSSRNLAVFDCTQDSSVNMKKRVVPSCFWLKLFVPSFQGLARQQI